LRTMLNSSVPPKFTRIDTGLQSAVWDAVPAECPSSVSWSIQKQQSEWNACEMGSKLYGEVETALFEMYKSE